MFLCNTCGHESPKWLGKCPDCGSWNSFHEVQNQKTRKVRNSTVKKNQIEQPNSVMELSENLSLSSDVRWATYSNEFDRVLGGGLTQNSVVLVSGSPGIGKSTLLLQTACNLKQYGVVLYVCAEESPRQVALRAKRLNLLTAENIDDKQADTISQDNILLTAENRIEQLELIIQKYQPICIIVDSIQTIRSETLGEMSGRISHMNACTSLCCEWTQRYNTTVFLIAHVTKDGVVAGPKAIEHMVDTVVMFEKYKNNVRFLYAQKNRYGATDEIGIFKMLSTGLADMGNTNSFFLEEREGPLPAGICTAATYEGSRPFLVEIQSLTIDTHGSSQNRVFSERIDARQIFRIAAVLERHLSLSLSNHAIYVNVAGGIRIQEPGFELALLIAIHSAYTQNALFEHMCAIGEVSLAGEIRPVEYFEQRCRQAFDCGFSTVIAPYHNVKKYTGKYQDKLYGVKTIAEALDIVMRLSEETT